MVGQDIHSRPKEVPKTRATLELLDQPEIHF